MKQVALNAAVDVDYREGVAHAGCVLFAGWTDETAARELTAKVPDAADYEPGHFYRRELPALLAVLQGLELETVVIDGYVQLDGRPGLGAHLHQALGGKVAVIGVAKTRFPGAEPVIEVLRGKSAKPLFVSAMGVEVEHAARRVREMHGPHRLPTLLKRADSVARGR